MRTRELNTFELGGHPRPHPAVGQTPRHRLNLVSRHEIEDFRHKLARGQIPPDLESKLEKLSRGDLAHRHASEKFSPPGFAAAISRHRRADHQFERGSVAAVL